MSEIPPHAIAVLRVCLAVMAVQILFFTQHLTMEQPCGCPDIGQSYPIREYEKFTDQDDRKRHINGVAAESKSAVCYQSVRMVCVDPNSKALSEGDDTPKHQQ